MFLNIDLLNLLKSIHLGVLIIGVSVPNSLWIVRLVSTRVVQNIVKKRNSYTFLESNPRSSTMQL